MLATPPKAALGRHLEAVANAAAEVTRLSRPVATLQARAEAAEEAQRQARGECSRLTEAHAAALASWAAAGGTGNAPTSSEKGRADAVKKAEATIEALNATRAALAEATEPFDKANIKLAELHSHTEILAVAVLGDMAQDTLANLAHARTTAAEAEAKARGLIAALLNRATELQRRNTSPETVSALFRTAESIRMSLNALPQPETDGRAIEAEAARWSETFKRLQTDGAED